jgi:hypothetical protein
MATYGDERFQQEAETCKAPGRAHFCTCDDTACPLNPNNPRNRERGRGCDGCIRKNLALGEIPSCFFNKVGPTADGWEDFSVAGFVRHCQGHGVA